MGQNETDETRQDRLTTRDSGRHISTYVTKARSAIYDSKSSKKALLTLDLFDKTAERSSDAAQIWLHKLRQVSENDCHNLFKQLPGDVISSHAKQFALTMLKLNKQRLLETEKP